MEDSTFKQALTEELDRIIKIKAIYEEELQDIPKGYITFKNVKGKRYPYWQYREGNTVKSIYIKDENKFNELQKAVSRRKELEQLIKRSRSDLKSLQKTLDIREKPGYTNGQIMSLSKLIADTVNPEKIILFGSYAYGKPTSKSDVDLMVVMKGQKVSDDDKIEALHKIFQRRLNSRRKWINSDISIVSMNDINVRENDTGSAIFDAMRKGKIIYDNNVQKGRVIR